MGSSKANSAIVHAGYDPKEGTLAAKYNVLGNEMFEDLCKELSVHFKRNGSLILSVGLILENELSSNAGIESDKRTNGLIVTESMETSVDGIFACGNVVHVHDLVDFVTQESKHAGLSVSRYIKEELKKDKYVNIINGKNVNYTVPQRLNVADVPDKLTIFMRVNNIYHDKVLVVRSGEEVIAKFKRAHLAPSEMEKVVLSKVLLDKVKGDITISLEDGE